MKNRNHLLDFIYNDERFFHYGQDLERHSSMLSLRLINTPLVLSVHPWAAFSITPASHICPMCSGILGVGSL